MANLNAKVLVGWYIFEKVGAAKLVDGRQPAWNC